MTWNEVLMYIIQTVLKILVVAIIPYGVNLLRVKLKNDTQIKYLDKFDQLIRDAVLQVQQTYVDNMKAENLFDKEAQLHALAMVKSAVYNMMNQRMRDIVIEAVGDFEEYITNKIEADVFTLKQNVAVDAK